MLRNKIISQNSNTTVFQVSYQGKIYKSLIDTEDFISLPDRLVNFKDGKQFYLKLCVNSRDTYLHRIIMKEPVGFVIDHINRDTLDNRKTNLRSTTQVQNCMNRVKNKNKLLPKGVFESRSKNYYSLIQFNGKSYNIGTFKTVDDAKRAYNNFGKFLSNEYFRAA